MSLSLSLSLPRRKADIRAADNNSHTPLLTAAANGQVKAFRALLRKGASLDVLDRDGKSVVFVAAEANHVSILKVWNLLTSSPAHSQLHVEKWEWSGDDAGLFKVFV